MIELRDVGLVRDGHRILSGIDLSLSEKRIGMIGANGSGKSSLARLLNGLLLPSEGEVQVDGLSTKDDAKAVRRMVGFVFQNPDNQIVMPTVGEDLAFGLKNIGLGADEVAARVAVSLRRFGLDDLENRMTHLLSEGEKQLVAIAGVTAMRPEIIVFDEPTTLLDLGNKRRVMEVILGLNERIVVISHDLDLLDDFDRVVCLHDGRVHADAAPADATAAYRRLFEC